MNTATKKIYSLALILTGIFTLLCTGCYIFALLCEYSALSGQFDVGAFSDIFLPLLYVLAFVVFLVFGIFFRDLLSARKAKTTLPLLFASGFAALSVVVWLFTFVFDFFRQTFSSIATVFGILLIVFGILAVCYFIFSAIPSCGQKQAILFGMGTSAFALVYAFFAYFDTAFALNSPIKLLDQVTVLVLLFFFLAEIRFRFGAISEAVFIPVCMTATVFAASGGIGALVYNVVTGQPLIVNTMHDFLLFGMAIYTAARLISFLMPAIGVTDELPPVVPAFETEGESTEKTEASPAQETFDFDKADDAADTPASNADDTDDGDHAQEAVLDLDGSKE